MLRRPEHDAVGVFAKAPVAGLAKTRLAAGLGGSAALEIYRRLGRQVTHAAADVHAVTVWYTPRGSRGVVSRWLDGGRPLDFRLQRGATLGERLTRAFQHHFAAGARRTVIVGTDCPAVDSRRIAAAFDSLDEADVVLGPAVDGGYYLIGLSGPAPGLFTDIPWSTGSVLAATRARAEALGLTCRLLRAERDVDTVADVRALGLWP